MHRIKAIFWRYGQGQIQKSAQVTCLAVIVLVCLVLTNCTWRPLYHTQKDPLPLGDIKIATIPGYNGQVLRNYLIEIFGETHQAKAPYVLHVALTQSTRSLGYNRDGTANRIEDSFTAYAVLKEQKNQRVIWKETIDTATARSIISTAPHVYHLSKESNYILEHIAHHIRLRVAQALSSPSSLTVPHENSRP